MLLAADAEELIVTYLADSGFTPVANEMPPTPVYPFILVTCIDSCDDYVTEGNTMSVHYFHNDMTLASTGARAMHLAMKNLLSPTVTVQMSEGNYVSIDYLFVIHKPIYVDYGDKEIKRYVGRYRIDLRDNLTT